MKTFKILFCIMIFIIGTNVYSNEYYSISNLNIYRDNLLSTSKGINYMDRFDTILDKYSLNTRVLLKLHERIHKLKNTIEFNQMNYSYELENLIYYIDQKINYQLFNLGVYESDGYINSDNEVENTLNKQDISHIFKTEYIDTNKSIIAGDDFVIFSGKTSSLYESVGVGSVTFYIEGIDVGNLKNSLSKANLYISNGGVNTVTSSSIDILSSSKVLLTFDDLQDFIVPQKEVEFRLGIEVNSIGYQKVGKTLKDLKLTSVVLSDATGVNSGKKINAFSTNTSVEPFSIVAGVPIVSVITNLNDSAIVRLNIKGIFGDNTIDSNNTTPSIQLNKLKFNVVDNGNSAIFKLVNTDDRNNHIVGIKNGNILEFDLNSLNKNIVSKGKGEDYEIYISNTTSLVTLELLKEGIEYDIPLVNNSNNLNINLQNNINLGTRDF